MFTVKHLCPGITSNIIYSWENCCYNLHYKKDFSDQKHSFSEKCLPWTKDMGYCFCFENQLENGHQLIVPADSVKFMWVVLVLLRVIN